MTSQELRKKFIEFFVARGHKEIAPAKLVPENDPTTLFTSSGMQPLIPYLLGETHPVGKRLVNSQPCFRAEDIEEVGDNRHTTFFEMLGNWSLGDYFKKEQLPWIWEFLTKELNLPQEKLYVSVFEGNNDVSKDTESYEIWKSLGLPEDHIYFYGANKNWWSRSGPPEKMPAGEIGGPDSEIFYDFGAPHDPKYGNGCHPNCDCGRFLEIGNSVFIQYQKGGGKLKELSQKNVDFGGGLERLTAAVNNTPDIFQIDLFSGARKTLEAVDTVNSNESKVGIRIVLDHIRAAIFITDSGIEPSNKGQGYILRRLIRRAVLHARIANINLLQEGALTSMVNEFTKVYAGFYPSVLKNKGQINNILYEELNKFERTIEIGMKKILSRKSGMSISGSEAFDFYQTYGFPPELIREFAYVDMKGFEEAMKHHQEQSRAASAGMFKGGLADHSEATTRGHTATHLLHQALRDVLGNTVHQTGSNITPERIRFDFSFNRKLTHDEIEKVEEIVNQRIKEDLPIHFEIMSIDDAKKTSAIGLFNEKYQGQVKIYSIGQYSKEFCGGPHVDKTSRVGRFTIEKEEALGSGNRRIYAKLS